MSMDRDQESFVSRRSFLSAASAATLAGTVAAAPLSALADEIPDAELLRLDRQHDAAFARAVAVNAGTTPIDDDELDVVCATFRDLEFAIQDIPAQTWAGVVVKARVAAKYVERSEDSRLLDDIVPSLIDDILRIANATGKRHARRHFSEEGWDDGTV